MGFIELRAAAQQALEALQELNGWQSLAPPAASRAAVQAAINLSAALAEPVEPVQEPRSALTVTDLQQALIETDLIDPDAIDDPEHYDACSTLLQIDKLYRMLTA